MKLKEVYDAIPNSTCPKGCGKCCGILYPSMAELRNIKEYCERKRIEFKSFNYTTGVDCPYLAADKSCQIYEARPFLCRILGVSVDLQPCPQKCKPEAILNHNKSSKLYSEIYLHGKEKARRNRHVKVLNEVLNKVRP